MVSVSALWCPLATPTVLLGLLLPWMWGMASRLLQQSTAAAPYLGHGVAPLGRRPDLRHGDRAEAWRWGDPSRPKSGAATESARLPRCRSSREELPHVQRQGGGRDELPHAGGQVWLLRWALSLSSCRARSAGWRWRWEGSKWRCFLNLSFTGRTGSFPMLSSLFNDWVIYFSPCLRPYWLRLGPLAVLATKETGQTSNRSSERDLIAGSIYLSQLP